MELHNICGMVNSSSITNYWENQSFFHGQFFSMMGVVIFSCRFLMHLYSENAGEIFID